jgi:hypothetical protein
MADKKKQHYVPRFYLKQYSNDETNIGLYNAISDKYFLSIPLRSQGYEDYLYGKNPDIENFLGKMENEFKTVIEYIKFHNGRIYFPNKYYRNILLYTLIQLNRTMMEKDLYEKQSIEMIRISSELNPNIKSLRTKDIKIKFAGVLPYCISIAVKNVHYIYDLDYRILINKTNDEFITSDNPVVKFNNFMNQFNLPSGGTGLISKGLQLFFPITKKYLLFLFDKNVYKVGVFFRKYVAIKSKRDVKKINALQYLNCRESIYFSSNVGEYYIRRLLTRYKKNRINEFNPVSEFVRKDHPEKLERLVRFGDRPIRINFDVDFFKVRYHVYLKHYKSVSFIPRTKKLEKMKDQFENKLQKKNLTKSST